MLVFLQGPPVAEASEQCEADHRLPAGSGAGPRGAAARSVQQLGQAGEGHQAAAVVHIGGMLRTCRRPPFCLCQTQNTVRRGSPNTQAGRTASGAGRSRWWWPPRRLSHPADTVGWCVGMWEPCTGGQRATGSFSSTGQLILERRRNGPFCCGDGGPAPAAPQFARVCQRLGCQLLIDRVSDRPRSWGPPAASRPCQGPPHREAMAAVDLEAYKDLDRAIEQLLQCKPLGEGEVKELCVKAQNVFVNENNVQPVAAPVTVRG